MAISESELKIVCSRLGQVAKKNFLFEIVSDIKGDDFNACCDSQGRIQVTSKFLADLRPDEAAGVLSHEMTHYLLSHHKKQYRSNILGALIGLGVAKAVGIKDQDGFEIGARLGAGIIGGATSRRQEYGADEEGIRLFRKVGYDPHAMIDLYRRFNKVGTRPGPHSCFRLVCQPPGYAEPYSPTGKRECEVF